MRMCASYAHRMDKIETVVSIVVGTCSVVFWLSVLLVIAAVNWGFDLLPIIRDLLLIQALAG